MPLLATLPVATVALIHTYIFTLESFLWTTPRGRKAFGLKPEFAAQTKSLAQNQGLYNAFLAAGLIWGIVHPVPAFGKQIEQFFLGCVAVAGVVGAATTGKGKIFVIQTVPAVAALAGVVLA